MLKKQYPYNCLNLFMNMKPADSKLHRSMYTAEGLYSVIEHHGQVYEVVIKPKIKSHAHDNKSNKED